jgi:hypothetical protein
MMTLDEKIMKTINELPESQKAQVLDFIEFLKAKGEERDWSQLSLTSAMRGMEEENSSYSTDDLKESFA